MDEPKYHFDDIDGLKRKPEIEGKTGTVIDLPGDRWIRVLAASDANPKWTAYRKAIAEGTRRLAGAEASDERYRRFIVPYYAEALCIDWGGFTNQGAEIPFSVSACKALLMMADDVYAAVAATVYDTKNFRGARIQALVDEAGN